MKIFNWWKRKVEEIVVPLTDQQKIDLLFTKADELGLKFEIFCTRFRVSDKDGFQGCAHRRTEPDDYTSDRWMQTGKTQADAAYALYISIQGAPTHPGRPRYVCPLPRIAN